MRLSQQPDQQDTDNRIERADLQELRIRRTSPMPDARDAYDDLKRRVLNLLSGAILQLDPEEPDSMRSVIQEKLADFLAQEKIILKRQEKRRLTNDILSELTAQQDSPAAEEPSQAGYTIQELREAAALSEEAAHFLETAVKARANIIISGPAAAGKTTWLRALCSSIPPEEQVVVVEQVPELLLDRPNLIVLASKTGGSPHRPHIPMEMLLMTGARMHPDRLILGSMQGAYAHTWLQLAGSNLRGSMAACTAETPQDLLDSLESMILLADPSLSRGQILGQIEAAVDLVVHLQRQSNRAPQIGSISKLTRDGGNNIVIIDAF